MVKIVQPPQIHYITVNDTMAVSIPKELLNGWENDHNFFLDLVEVKQKGFKKLDLQKLWHDGGDPPSKRLRRYFYAPQGVEKLSTLIEQRDREMQEAYHKEWERVAQYDCLETITERGFDPQNLFYLDTSCNLIYGYRQKNPYSRPYRIDYIGGIDNGEFDLSRAEEILSAHPWVTAIERIDIPYYNCDGGRNRAIEFTVNPPQEDFEKLVELFRDEKKEEFWMCRLKDIFGVGCRYYEGVDPLGLCAALKNES
jgi:hypothetical protein